MIKEVSPASWVGKAAYELIHLTGRTGASAHVTACALATELLDDGADLGGVNARKYVRQHLGLPPSPSSSNPWPPPPTLIAGKSRPARTVSR